MEAREFEPDPRAIIERYLRHHRVEPMDVLEFMRRGLGRYHLFGNLVFPEDPPSPEESGVEGLDARSVATEVLGHMLHVDPPRDPDAQMPRSLLEAVSLCMEYERQAGDDQLAVYFNDDVEPDHPDLLDHHAELRSIDEGSRAYPVILLIMREYMNRLEHKELEISIEEEGGDC